MTDAPHRIAFCITELDPGGAERALVEIVTRLDRSRWEPRLFCLAGQGELSARLSEADIPVQSLGARSRWDLAVIRRLHRELLEFRPELLQTFLFHANIVGRLAGWKAHVPVIVSGVRVIERDARWRMRLDRMTSRLVTHTVCVSEALAATYRSLGFSDEYLSVIPNGVDVERFAAATAANLAELGLPSNARTILAVGRLHPQKGFDLLLEAVEPILNDDAEIHLLIVGEGPQREALEESIAGSAHPSRIHLLGRRDDVPSLMRACEVFVLSSRWEGMPNVVLEAMAAGLPVVATDVEGVRDVLADGESGIIVERNSARSLSVGLRSVLDGEESSLSRMGSTGQQRVRDRFSWDRAAEEYERLYQGLLLSSEACQ